jgi:tRNA(Ile)-lysidine synthase TilS/MesJ
VKALAIMSDKPGISGNKIVRQLLRIQKSSWSQLRAFLETRQYIECECNDDSHVVRMSVADHGAEWLASKQAEAS